MSGPTVALLLWPWGGRQWGWSVEMAMPGVTATLAECDGPRSRAEAEEAVEAAGRDVLSALSRRVVEALGAVARHAATAGEAPVVDGRRPSSSL